ncbi:MAG: transcription antitermination factor NusB [Clostridia bacterium]|nr:transcription antitermination factor NusB [Clostridia bacterium]
MNRREARELAFVLLFEQTFSPQTAIGDILQVAGEARGVEEDGFALSLAQGTAEHLEDIDAKISAYSVNWNKDRLSRVALSLLRLCVYEIFYRDDIPVSVSINEAVELAKTYGGADDASFVNGVLGGIARADAPAQT